MEGKKKPRKIILMKRKKGGGGEEMLDESVLHIVHPKAVSTQSDLGQAKKSVILYERRVQMFFCCCFNFLLIKNTLFLLQFSCNWGKILMPSSIIYNSFYSLPCK